MTVLYCQQHRLTNTTIRVFYSLEQRSSRKGSHDQTSSTIINHRQTSLNVVQGKSSSPPFFHTYSALNGTSRYQLHDACSIISPLPVPDLSDALPSALTAIVMADRQPPPQPQPVEQHQPRPSRRREKPQLSCTLCRRRKYVETASFLCLGYPLLSCDSSPYRS